MLASSALPVKEKRGDFFARAFRLTILQAASIFMGFLRTPFSAGGV